MDDLLRGPVDHVVVGRNLPTHDRLAEAPTGLDDHVILPGVGVAGEQNAADGRIDHLLDEDGEAHGALVEPLSMAVDEDSRREQRSPALAHGRHHLVGPRDVEIGVLESGERGPFEVFRRGARPDRAESHRELTNERLVRRLELLLEGRGERDRFEGPSNAHGRRLDGVGALRDDRCESGRDLRLEGRLFDERIVRFRRQDKTGGHRQPLADQLAELARFSSDQGKVGLRHFG